MKFARALHALGLVTLTLTLTLPCRVQSLDFVYHDHGALEAHLTNISETYPEITHLYSIGKSVENRNMWVLAIGESPKDHVTLRPNFKYVGGIHGNEVVGRENLLHLIEYLVTNYGQDENISRLLNTTTVHILPDMNPDGFAAANSTDCTGVQGRYNANGFDLNRNFPDFFIPEKSARPIQPETRAIMDWVATTQFVLSAGLHGGALVASYPFDNYMGSDVILANRSLTSLATNTHGVIARSPDHDLLVHLARTYADPHPTMKTEAQCDMYNFTDGITNGAQWYPLTGGMQDHNYLVAGCIELSLELSCCKYPPVDELQSFWDANRQSMLDLMQKVHMGVKGLVKDNKGRPVEGVTVTVQGREMVTSHTTQHGEYWKILLPGYYRLVVSKDGCNPQTYNFQVETGSVTRLDVTYEIPDEPTGSGMRLSGTLFLGLLLPMATTVALRM